MNEVIVKRTKKGNVSVVFGSSRAIIRNVDTFTEWEFDAVYKGYSIYITYSEENQRYSITVESEERWGVLYDGFWEPPGPPKMVSAIAEAMVESGLVDDCG